MSSYFKTYLRHSIDVKLNDGKTYKLNSISLNDRYRKKSDISEDNCKMWLFNLLSTIPASNLHNTLWEYLKIKVREIGEFPSDYSKMSIIDRKVKIINIYYDFLATNKPIDITDVVILTTLLRGSSVSDSDGIVRLIV